MCFATVFSPLTTSQLIIIISLQSAVPLSVFINYFRNMGNRKGTSNTAYRKLLLAHMPIAGYWYIGHQKMGILMFEYYAIFLRGSIFGWMPIRVGRGPDVVVEGCGELGIGAGRGCYRRINRFLSS
jgi:hypothetical protein